MVVVVVVAVLLLGCSDGGEPSAETIAAAEELASAALLTEGDLPPGDWAVQESGLGELREQLATSIDAYATSPPECRSPDPPPNVETVLDGLLVLQTRAIVAADADVPENVRGISASVMVFESAERALNFLGDSGPAESPAFSEACRDIRATSGYEVRMEATRYGLADEQAYRSVTAYTTSAGTMEVVMEQHTFARGWVVASYVILGGDEPSREIDHKGLLAAFEARVVAAQE